MEPIKTVILPVAGRGTRLLPLTKSVPKELLPIYDKPVLQFAVQEAIAAGARRLVLITSPEKPAIADFLSPDEQLERTLVAGGKAALARLLRETRPDHGVEIVMIEQREPLGLGHAVGPAADCVDREPFGVILPDDCILGAPCLAEMAAAYDGGDMIAAMNVARHDVSKYGIFVTEGDSSDQRIASQGIVEKPDADKAPSTLAAVGRYILSRDVLDLLQTQGAGSGGEIQLTDAIDRASDPLWAFRFTGARFDCGSRDGLLAAGQHRQAELSDRKIVAFRAAPSRELQLIAE